MVATISVEEKKEVPPPPAPAATPKISEAQRNFILYKYLSLRTTSLIIAWLTTVISIILTSAQISIYLDKLDIFNRTSLQNSSGIYVPNSQDDTMAGLISESVIGGLSITVNILLLVGIYKTSHRLMLPWLIVKGLTYIIVIFVTARMIYKTNSSSTDILFKLCVLLFAEGLGIYGYYIVLMYYKTLRNIYLYKKQKFEKLQEDKTIGDFHDVI